MIPPANAGGTDLISRRERTHAALPAHCAFTISQGDSYMSGVLI